MKQVVNVLVGQTGRGSAQPAFLRRCAPCEQGESPDECEPERAEGEGRDVGLRV